MVLPPDTPSTASGARGPLAGEPASDVLRRAVDAAEAVVGG